MKCKELRVFYDQDNPKKAGATKGAATAKSAPAQGTMKAAQPGPGRA